MIQNKSQSENKVSFILVRALRRVITLRLVWLFIMWFLATNSDALDGVRATALIL
jgi:hypothetical protein